MRPLTVRNFGGVNQVQIVDAQDLARIDVLDAARWAATSAPLADLHTDPAFLAYVDADKKGRIRVAEIVRARDWLFERLSGREGLAKRSETLALRDLDTSRDAGRELSKAARRILEELKAANQEELTLGQVRGFRTTFVSVLANGDGVVPVDAIADADAATLAKAVVATVGAAKDLSGKDGVDEAKLAGFLDGARAHLAWKRKPASDATILPLGDDTAAAAALVAGLDAKLEELFWVCDLFKQEEGGIERVRLSGEDWKAFRSPDAAAIEKYLSGSPLAAPNRDGTLSLTGEVNPVYAERLAALRTQVVTKLLSPDETTLTRASWRKIKAALAPFGAWQKEKQAAPFEKLDDAALEGWLDGKAAARIRELIAVDAAAKAELGLLADLEKLVLYQSRLIELANNFVNFSAIYHPEQTALVEMGTLILDGRRFELCVRVTDRGAHKKVAAESLIFLVYAEVREKDGDKPVYEVMAPVTAGERGRLRVGKRGIFHDNDGKEWDALIVDVVENPISVLEAMKAPFRRAAAFVSKKIEEMAASKLDAAEKGAQEGLGKGVDKAAAPPPAPAAAPAAAPAQGGMSNMLLYGSVAFAAIGSAFTFILAKLAEINPFDLLGAVFGLVAIIAGVSGFLGWLKLRRRDLSLVLEANGWAVNAEMKLTRRIAGIMTRRPALPKGTVTDRKDMLAAWKSDEERKEDRRKWLVRAALVAVVVVVVGTYASRPFCPFVNDCMTQLEQKVLGFKIGPTNLFEGAPDAK